MSEIQAPSFVHLRFHSDYSITDGVVRLDPILEHVREDGGVALGITDSMNIFGGLRFYTHAIADGIKPVVGCDLWVTNHVKRDQPFRLTVYCQNHDGYLALCDLLSRGWMDNQYLGRGEIDLQWLTSESCKGLIALSGGPKGMIERKLLDEDEEAAAQIAQKFKSIFGDRFYCEVQRAGRPFDQRLVAAMARLSVQEGIPLVATHPIQFLSADDYEVHEIRCCIAGGYAIGDTSRPREFTPEQYCKSTAQMQELFHDLPQALANSVVIAQRCNLDGVLQKPQLPLFPTPEGVSLDEYMAKLSREGLERRLEFLYPDEAERERVRPEYSERLEYELKTITDMKFPGYFLIVQDFINWSKRNGVAVGPGRGSGAGSLVAYALGITDLDPLHYGLLFERFLNPERVSMPDFDIDFCQHNRDRTIEYVKRAYGADAVSQIVTFGTMGAKVAVRDVGRVLSMSYGKVDALARLIPQKPGQNITLQMAREMEPDFAALANTEEYAELVPMAEKLEGLTRNLGMHAGGVLIAPGKLTDFCPLYNADGRPENTVSQFDKKDVESIGLVKFDFLGLTTLTILEKAVEYIDRLNRGTHFDLSRIPVKDEATMKLFQEGNTGAIFQFESPGMRKQLRDARPDCLEDLVALNALYRPGPMDQIPHFIDRKFGREKVEYLDPRMEPILAETYGIMVYQEQVMLVARAIGGYSLGGADLLRRAMGKKNVEEMKRQRAVFCAGAAERGVSEETATEIFNLMEKFAGYGFNKSHAAAYSYVAWQTAYLKAHYPACFTAGNLCLTMDQAEKMRNLILDAHDMGVTVLPPDINESEWYCVVPDHKTVRLGLGTIKGVGQGVVEDILAERRMNGPYLDIFDLSTRVSSVNRKVLEQCIRAGAFDALDEDRGKLMANVEQAMLAAQTAAASAGQGSLFVDELGEAERIVSWVKGERWDEKTKVAQEKAAFGFCLTIDILGPYHSEIKEFAESFTALQPQRQLSTVAGLVQEVRVLLGKRGKFAIVTLTDGVETLDVFVSGNAFENSRDILKADEILVFTGRVRPDQRSEKMTLSAVRVQTMEDLRKSKNVFLSIVLNATEATDAERLKALIDEAKVDASSGVRAEISFTHNGMQSVMDLNDRFEPTNRLVELLRTVPGVTSARYCYHA